MRLAIIGSEGMIRGCLGSQHIPQKMQYSLALAFASKRHRTANRIAWSGSFSPDGRLNKSIRIAWPDAISDYKVGAQPYRFIAHYPPMLNSSFVTEAPTVPTVADYFSLTCMYLHKTVGLLPLHCASL